MSITVNINNLSLCHKGSNGVSTATIPDVCKTPSPGGPVPLPYPNVAFSMDLMKGTSTVKADGGMMCANYGSEFFKSTGDEPGVVGGLGSNVFIKQATWTTFSFDVKMQGKAACRLTDKMFHNHQNTLNTAGEMQSPLATLPKDINCEAAWAAIDKETKEIADTKDPFERNKKITKAYQDLYDRNPNNTWCGLASVVSSQAGCAMERAKSASESWIPMKSGPAGNAFEGLAEANKAIFEDVYPPMRFAEKYGAAALRACSVDANGKTKADPKLVEAAEEMEKGTPESVRSAADKIAEYEQKDIIQDKIYANAKYKDAFKSNEKWAKRPIGRWMGAEKPEIPMSKTCGATPTIPFSGSIINDTDRVNYYNDLMDAFSRKGTGG